MEKNLNNFKEVQLPAWAAEAKAGTDATHNKMLVQHWMGCLTHALADSCEWHKQQQRKFVLHPAINRALDYKPVDWMVLVLEWPHVSEKDDDMLAYTRDERAGEADRQTRTSLGKYLRRHFPDMPDHVLRDIVALHAGNSDKMEIRRDIPGMVEAAIAGPKSCMTHVGTIHCDDGVLRHPYQAYDPSLGWGVAVRICEGRIDGRAVVNIIDDNRKFFVRTFKRDLDNEDGYSYSDEALHAWLISQGFEHAGDWAGCYLKKYPVNGSFLVPYLDGCVQTADASGKGLLIDSCGSWDCEVTDGVASGDPGHLCDCCDEYYPRDEMHCVGYHGDYQVCDYCLSENYVFAFGRDRHEYYVHENSAIEVNGTHYHDAYLSENGVVEDVDGDFAMRDDCVLVGDSYYLENDRRIVLCADDEYRLARDCTKTDGGDWYEDDDPGLWICARSGGTYHTDADEPVEIDGKTIHEDELTEEERNERANACA